MLPGAFLSDLAAVHLQNLKPEIPIMESMAYFAILVLC